VTTSNGTADWWASTTAAWNSAAAVPLVQSSTAGTPVRAPQPTAAKEAERSSMTTSTCHRGSVTRASANGVERDPGETKA